MNEIGSLTISKRASEFIRETVDQIYLNDNYHCCTTDKYEIWHVGTCCVGTCSEPCCADGERQGQIMTCHEFWTSKSLVSQHMRKNNFLKNLQRNGAAGCVMQIRKAHFLWAHGDRIYDKEIPNELADEIVAAATRDKTYSRSPVLGLYINEKMCAS